MRHSLSFDNRSDAEQAQAKITESVLGVKDCQIQQGDQAGTIELVFSTSDPLPDWMQRFLVRSCRPDSFTFNQP